MTVAELRTALLAYPDDMQVGVSLHSEYTADVKLAVKELRASGGYLTRDYPFMREELKVPLRPVLTIS